MKRKVFHVVRRNAASVFTGPSVTRREIHLLYPSLPSTNVKETVERSLLLRNKQSFCSTTGRPNPIAENGGVKPLSVENNTPFTAILQQRQERILNEEEVSEKNGETPYFEEKEGESNRNDESDNEMERDENIIPKRRGKPYTGTLKSSVSDDEAIKAWNESGYYEYMDHQRTKGWKT